MCFFLIGSKIVIINLKNITGYSGGWRPKESCAEQTKNDECTVQHTL